MNEAGPAFKLPCIPQEILQRSIQKYLGASEGVEVLWSMSEAAVPDGENYGSNLYRITALVVDNEYSKISVIAKCALDSKFKYQEISDQKIVFEKETLTYNEILPQIDTLMYTNISPKCLHASTENENGRPILILEDLSLHKYQVVDRLVGLNFQHCLKVLQMIAKVHAASFVMHRDNPDTFKIFQYGCFVEKPEIKEFIKKSFTDLIKTCESTSELKIYAYKLQEIGAEELMRRGFKAMEKRTNQFDVLNHGDLWSNNMMFLYDDENDISDLKLLDWQLSCINSPSIDLHYFIANSMEITDDNVFETIIETLLACYYSHLWRNCMGLRLAPKQIPPKSDIVADFNARVPFGLMVAACVSPIIKTDKDTSANTQNTVDVGEMTNSFRRHAFSSERYLHRLRTLLNFYQLHGALDCQSSQEATTPP